MLLLMPGQLCPVTLPSVLTAAAVADAQHVHATLFPVTE